MNDRQQITMVCRVKFVVVTLFLVAGMAATGWIFAVDAMAGSFTVTSSMTLKPSDLSKSEIHLASMTSEPQGEGDLVLRLAWFKEETTWFPVWKLVLVSETDFLPLDRPKHVGEGYGFVELDRALPAENETYDVTLSYSANLGALSVQVHDVTNDKSVYVGGFNVPTRDGGLHAAEGVVTHQYVPVGLTWNPGIQEPSRPFLAMSKYKTREEEALLRVVSPTAVEGELQVYLDLEEGSRRLFNVKPEPGETYVPFSLDPFPLGDSQLRVDYVHEGETLLSTSKTVKLGHVDVVVEDPLYIRPEDRAVDVRVHFESASPVKDCKEVVEATLTASLYELRWNAENKRFDEVLYETTTLYDDVLDLRTASTDEVFVIDMPEKEANWKVVLDAALNPPILGTMNKERERYFSTYAPAQVEPGEPYTIVVFPDTQFFADRYPHIYTRMTDWVAEKAEELNIAAALHVGDITDRNTPMEWRNAYASMSLLHGVVPYALSLGNHDMGPPTGGQVTNRGDALINDYFSVEEAERFSGLAGTMKPDTLENHYHLWTIGDDEYIVISLEFGPPNEALDWANEIARQYPYRKLIFLTHAFSSRRGGYTDDMVVRFAIAQNPDTTVNTGREMWTKFVRRQANSFMTVSGHHSTDLSIPHNVSRGVGGPIYELLINYQSQPMGGNGWLGLMTFRPDDTIDVRLYSPYLDEYANQLDVNGFGSHLVIDLNEQKIIQLTQAEEQEGE